MALRTTYISRVACACFASGLRDILCHARTDFQESDWLLPERAVSIGSDRVCLPTFSTPFAPVNPHFRYHWSSAMQPFPVPVAIGLNPPASEVNPTQVECIGHVWSTMEKYFAPFNFGRTSSSVGVQWCDRLMALFKSFGSRHSLKLPLLFVTQTREFTQTVGSSTLEIIPCATSESSSFFSGPLRAAGTRRGGCITGGTVGSRVIWNSPWKQPMPSRQSVCCWISCFLASGFPAGVEVMPAIGVDSLWVIV